MADEAARMRMVNNQLRTFDVTDRRVQDAMLAVDRARFVPRDQRGLAYSDVPIALQRDPLDRATRTMTRPAILGRLLQLAHPVEEDVVLVVGAGLGYSAAVLGLLAGSVIALECDGELAGGATEALEASDVANASVVVGPLPDGWPSEAPYDLVFVDGAIQVEPTALLAQLKEGGRLVAIHGEGLAGRARLWIRGAAGASVRDDFNAAADTLPGFAREASFVF